jgi:hypothetical protein
MPRPWCRSCLHLWCTMSRVPHRSTMVVCAWCRYVGSKTLRLRAVHGTAQAGSVWRAGIGYGEGREIVMLRQLRIPPVFEAFCFTHFALTRHDIREWWRAVSLSQSPRVIALRGTLQYRGVPPYRRANVVSLMRLSITPQELVETAELLVQECRLTRQCATRVQDAILQRTGPSGAWT